MLEFLKRFNLDYFFSVPVQSKVIYFWLGLYLLFLLSTIVLYVVYRRKGKKGKPYKVFMKKILWTEIPITTLGLILVFIRYESLQVWSWRFWQYLAFLLLVFANTWLVIEWKKFKKEQFYYHSQKRKDKWLKNKS